MQTRGRVLIVEDDAAILRFFERSLRAEHDVFTAPDGEEALALVRSGQRYDLILCDLQMPNMTGVDFLMNIDEVAIEQVSRIVFLSANPKQPMAQLLGGHVVMDKGASLEHIADFATQMVKQWAAA